MDTECVTCDVGSEFFTHYRSRWSCDKVFHFFPWY